MGLKYCAGWIWVPTATGHNIIIPVFFLCWGILVKVKVGEIKTVNVMQRDFKDVVHDSSVVSLD